MFKFNTIFWSNINEFCHIPKHLQRVDRTTVHSATPSNTNMQTITEKFSHYFYK